MKKLAGGTNWLDAADAACGDARPTRGKSLSCHRSADVKSGTGLVGETWWKVEGAADGSAKLLHGEWFVNGQNWKHGE